MKRHSRLAVLVLVFLPMVVAFKGIEPFPRSGGRPSLGQQREMDAQRAQMERRQQAMELRMQHQESEMQLRQMEMEGMMMERNKGMFFLGDD